MKKKTVTISLGILFSLLLLSFAGFRYFKYREYVNNSPYDVILSDIKSDSATVSWKTKKELPSYLRIGESEKEWGSENLERFHRVVLRGLKPQSRYTFKISDGEGRVWEEVLIKNSSNLEQYLVEDFVFNTKEEEEEIALPLAEEVKGLPNEIVYVVVQGDGKREIRSVLTNRFGGGVIDLGGIVEQGDSFEVEDIKYLSNLSSVSNNSVFASDINCNQKVPAQSIDGLTKEQFADLATRWTASRGKHHALECFNDVIYRAKREGVDPAFALTIWLNESGASNYTHNSSLMGMIEDFGIHGQGSAPPQDFNAQIEYFLKLKFEYNCPGLSFWEAWGNMYRWGSCNTDDPVKRQVGIDYYKAIESVYGLVTNGRKLPSQVVGLPKSQEGNQDTSGGQWSAPSGPLCCALKISNQEKFRGDYENNAQGKSCSEVWQSGRPLFGGVLEYSVEIKGRVENACEVEYEGVCCQLPSDIKWYPKESCQSPIPSASTFQECKELVDNKACFFRDAKYQWLSKSIGEDFLKDVNTQSACEARNSISVYKIVLKKGVNFVGFDFSPLHQTSPMLASVLLSKNSSIELVGDFEAYDWKSLVKRSADLPFAGNDFSLVQSKGYLIVSSADIVLEVDGWRDSSSTYAQPSQGWNLVGGSLYTNARSASGLISKLEKSSIDIDTVATWSYELGRFQYRREESNESIYGEDFTLQSAQGIFIRK
ncbi:MAG: fibronectin type III domain-containing protein [Candidatus Dojkabacteria bacterium]